MVSDKLIINGISYGIDDIHTLPPELAAYKPAEKLNETHLVFAESSVPIPICIRAHLQSMARSFTAANSGYSIKKPWLLGTVTLQT